MEQFFSNYLLLVPLFHGLSRLDFLDIVEETPFDFRTLPTGETIVRQGEESKGLFMLLQGEVDAEVDSPSHTYHITERLQAPYVLQTEYLFGLHNRFTHTFRAAGKAHFVLLDKQHVRRLLQQYPTFQINFYNLVCTQAQNSANLLWKKRGDTLVEQFRYFLLQRCLRPIGQKTLHIRMEDLAKELGVTRLRISQMLAQLSRQKRISYSREKIIVPYLEKLGI